MNYSLTRNRDPFFSLFNELLNQSYETGRAVEPAFEAQEEEGHYRMSIDLPGVSPADIKLEVHDQQVRVAAERRREGQKTARYERAFNFTDAIDAAKVEADYRDGVLRVYLPKHEAAKPKQIAVHGAETAQANSGFFTKWLGTKETKAA